MYVYQGLRNIRVDTCADETIVLTIGWMFIVSQRILRLLVVIIKYSSQAILLKSG